MQCTQHTIRDIPSNCDSIRLVLSPDDSEVSLVEHLERFSQTISELTIVNSYTSLTVSHWSILSTMPRLTYLNIESDTPIDMVSLKDSPLLYDVRLSNCIVSLSDLPNSITTLYLSKCIVNDLDTISKSLPNLYRLVIMDMTIDKLPDMSELDDLTVLEILGTVKESHPSLYSRPLEVLEIGHVGDPLILEGDLSSDDLDSIVLCGDIMIDNLTVQNRVSNLLISNNSVVTRLPTLKKGTELVHVNDCKNLKVYAIDLYQDVGSVILDSHKYLNADDTYTTPIHIVSNSENSRYRHHIID